VPRGAAAPAGTRRFEALGRTGIMGSVNKAILVGNLGRDAEMRFTAGGTPVATVSLATTERFTDRDGQKREDTQWHRIVIWGKTAESLHEYLTKGKQIYVEGRIQTREWQDKEGKTQKTTEIRADRIVLLSSAGGEGRGGMRPSRERYVEHGEPTADVGAGAGTVDTPNDDDIPF
jgi:single-strand DNA-binding protein